ncbi:MAG: hypothetical protein WCO98_11760 [bacterium]
MNNHVMKHGFLSPNMASWVFWTSTGSRTITNQGASHRVLESLVYAIDELAKENWFVRNVFVEGGNPVLVLLERREEVNE